MSTRVRMRVQRKHGGRALSPGDELEVSPGLAERWVRRGIAGFADASPGEPENAGHSDQEIEQIEALLEAIPGLNRKQAGALVVAGYGDVEALAEVDNGTLAEIDGIAAGTIAKIREVVPAPGAVAPDDDRPGTADDAADAGDASEEGADE